MRLSQPGKNILYYLGFSVFFAFVLLVKIYYRFEKSDHLQYLLLPYRNMYENFLPGDWFTWDVSHYHFTFSWLVQGIYFLFGSSGFVYGILIVHFLVLAGLCAAILKLARSLNFSFFSAAVCVLLIAFVRHHGIAHTVVNHGFLLPADIAFVFLLFAMSSWINKKYLTSGILLGLSGFIHVNFAILGPLLFAGPQIYLIIKEKKYKETIKLALGFLFFAWPTLLITVFSILKNDQSPEALGIVFKIRSPHHYNPSFLTSVDIFWPLALLAAGLPKWLLSFKRDKQSNRAASFWGAILVITLLATQLFAAAATYLELNAVVRMFLWRLSIPLIIILALAAAESLYESVKSYNITAILFSVSAFVIILSFTSKGSIDLGNLEFSGFGWTLPAIIPVMFSAFFLVITSPKIHRISFVISALVILWCALVSFPGILASPSNYLNWDKAVKKLKKNFAYDHIKKELTAKATPINLWIRKHTPSDARFLIPPGESRFRLQARRAVFVDSKCCPMTGSQVLEWRRRLLAVMGMESLPLTTNFQNLARKADRAYYSRSLADLARLATMEGLTFILARDKSGEKKANLKKIYKNGRMAVYKLKDVNLKTNSMPPLPDYSYAGYYFGEKSLPELSPTIDVTDFGAVPNDSKDDTSALKKAFKYAHTKNDPQVLYFPSGRFILKDILYIEKSNIVIKGSGSGEDGTVIYMPNPLKSLPVPPDLIELDNFIKEKQKREFLKQENKSFPYSIYAWSGGFIWSRKPGKRVKYYLSRYDKPVKSLASVLSGKRGEHKILVDDALNLVSGKRIRINWFNTEGKKSSLIRYLYANKPVSNVGERHWQNPGRPLITQEAVIEKIDGDTVVLKDPLLHDIRAQWKPSISDWPHISQIGIEHIRFEFPDTKYAGHHLADGYNAIFLTGAADSWVRDVKIHNCDNGILVDESANITIDDIEVTGRLRHYSVSLGSVYNALAKNIVSKGPALHSISFNTRARRSVYSGVEIHETPSLDMHSGTNHHNLFERITAKIKSRNDSLWKPSGPYYWKPTHGPFTTFWNIKINFDFENRSGRPVVMNGIMDSPLAVFVGVYANYPLRLKYNPTAYMGMINRQNKKIPSLYLHQLKKRQNKKH